MKRVLVAALVLLFLSGCSNKKTEGPTLVEELTGAEQIKTYQKTKTKIQEINKAMGERAEEI